MSAEACVFCDIVAGTAPAKIVHEWPDSIAFVPLGPVVDGHVLVVPRQHVADAVEDPAVTAMTMARAAELAAEHEASNILTSIGRPATQSVFHLHIHVIRREAGDQLMVPWGTTGNPHDPHSCKRSAQAEAELAAKDAKIERLRERVAELSKWEVGVKNLTAADGSIDMSVAMAHDMMRIYVSAFTEILDEQGGPNYVEMMFKLAGTLDTYTVTIRRPKGKTPGEVASEQRQRAKSAEATIGRVRALAEAARESAAANSEPGDPLRPLIDVGRLLAALEPPEEAPVSFNCPVCGKTSYNPNDAREGYCGACHAFTGHSSHCPPPPASE